MAPRFGTFPRRLFYAVYAAILLISVLLTLTSRFSRATTIFLFTALTLIGLLGFVITRSSAQLRGRRVAPQQTLASGVQQVAARAGALPGPQIIKDLAEPLK